MKIKFGSIVTHGSGKLGGHEYVRQGSRAYIRTGGQPLPPPNPEQQRNNAIVRSLVSMFSGLSKTQRESWKKGAQLNPRHYFFGEWVEMTAQNYFVHHNYGRVNAGQPIDTDYDTGGYRVAPNYLKPDCRYPWNLLSLQPIPIQFLGDVKMWASMTFPNNQIPVETPKFVLYDRGFGEFTIMDDVQDDYDDFLYRWRPGEWVRFWFSYRNPDDSLTTPITDVFQHCGESEA